MKSGETFAIVELLDPRDSIYFRKAMRRRGLREVTPRVRGHTFRSGPPTEEWMRYVANLDPEWWYISGHFGGNKFFNEPYYRTVWRHRSRSDSDQEPSEKNWQIKMISPSDETADHHDDEPEQGGRDPTNFFEKYGPGSYPRAKIVLMVGCNTLVDPLVRTYLSKMFPNAISLGHVAKNPGNATPIIVNFIRKYFAKRYKAEDWKHIVSSWLSYHDKVRNSIFRRGYGLAALYAGSVIGIGVDKAYPRVIGEDKDIIERLRLRSKNRRGRKVDVLVAKNEKGEYVAHEGMYQGDKHITYFDFPMGGDLLGMDGEPVYYY